MTQHTYQTAPTQYVEARGIRFAYRRFGKAGGAPLVLFMHFTGTMDHWDPAVTDGLAAHRQLILVGTGPRSGEGMATLTPEAQAIFGKSYASPDELWQHVHFDTTETSQAAGAAFLKRLRLRREKRDPEGNAKVAPAQIQALSQWGAPRENPYEYLKAIEQPTLVVNGDHD